LFPSLRHAAKIRGGPPAVPSPGQATASTTIDQDSSTPVDQDKQMPNTALALLDTVTEPAIAVARRDRCEWLVSAVPHPLRHPIAAVEF
jgi:hypothetical protein